MAENKTETAVVGGRPGEGVFYDDRTSSGRPLAAGHRRTSPVQARRPAPVELPEGTPLPAIGVARQVLGRHTGELAAEAAKIERDLSRNPGIGATGVQMPYLIEQRGQLQEALLNLREEIERLNGLSDAQVQGWAAEHGRILYR